MKDDWAAKSLSLTLTGYGQSLKPAKSRRLPRKKPERVLSPGTVINSRYKVEEVLGKGGMGVVYRVSDRINTDRMFALKILRGSIIRPEQLGLFKAEFKTMAHLCHLNVVAVYDFESFQGTDDFLFTMDYVDGDDIRKACKANWKETLGLLVQVCRALSFMHSRQVIHFDLKPANVLVTRDGQVKVLDFGLAGAKSILSGGHVVGTPMYMAPELISSNPSMVDHRVDLYSLGIMAYELLCGKKPFTAETSVEMYQQNFMRPIEFDEKIRRMLPEWLIRIVTRLCAKDPAERYRTANSVIEALNLEGDLSYEIETQETRECYILSSRFVGRDQEFKYLCDSIGRRSSYMEGKFPPAIMVCGQSGIGKSRLMREIRQYMQLSRMIFVEGNCYEGTFSEYSPLVEVLEHVVRIAEALGGEDLLKQYGSELAKISPQLVQVIKTDSPFISEDPEAERLRMMEQVSEFMVKISTLAPYILYINDLQWAQAGTTDLLSHLILRISLQERMGERVRLIIFGSYRDDEVEGRPIERLLKILEMKQALHVIKLAPLENEHVRSLVGSMLGIEQLPEAFINRVAEETAGNPFFVEEVMRTLVENKTVFLQNGKWAASDDVGEIEIPTTIAKVFQRRVSLLDTTHRMVLEIIAVCGQPISPLVLKHVTKLNGELVHLVLAGLVKRQMVVRQPGKVLLFRVSHDRMRETLYKGLDPEKRKQLHLLIAEVLESIYADELDDYIYELAHHYWLTDNRERALEYSMVAGNKASDEYANHLAIDLFHRVLQLLPEDADYYQQRLEVIEKLGDLYLLTGEFTKSLEHYNRVLAEYKNNLDKGRLHRKMGVLLFQRGDLPECIEHCWEALQLLGESRPKNMPGYGFAVVSAILKHLFHRFFPRLIRKRLNDEKRALYEELSTTYVRLTYVHFFHLPLHMILPSMRATNIAERLGESRELSHAYGITGLVYALFGFHGSADVYGQNSIDIAERLNSPWHIGHAYSFKGIGHYYRSEWDKTLDLVSRAKEHFLNYGDMYELSKTYVHLVYCLMFRGELKSALQTSQEAVEIMERTGSMQLGKALIGLTGLNQAKLGNTKEAIVDLELVISLSQRAYDTLILCAAHMEMGECLLIAGEIDKAIEHLERAKKIREDHKVLADYVVPVYPLLGRVYFEKNRSDPDKQRCAHRLKYAGKVVRKGLRTAKMLRLSNNLPPIYLSLGLFEWQKGRHDQARKFFERSIKIAQQYGALLMHAETCYHAGRYMIEGDEADVRLGVQYLKKALAFTEECGAKLYAADIRVLLDRL